jgi:hypothetical protein
MHHHLSESNFHPANQHITNALNPNQLILNAFNPFIISRLKAGGGGVPYRTTRQLRVAIRNAAFTRSHPAPSGGSEK